MLKENTMLELSKIISTSQDIARLNLRENILKDEGMSTLAHAIS